MISPSLLFCRLRSRQWLGRSPVLVLVSVMALGQLSGCASVATPSSLENAQAQFAERYGEQGLQLPVQAPVPMQALASHNTAIQLPAPLSLAHSLQASLLYSPEVRASLAQLGIADAALLQAELIANPQLSLGATRPEGGGRWKIESGISQPLLSFLTRPLSRQLAREQQLSAQLQLQQRLQQLLGATSNAWYNAVAAQQALQVQQQMQAASNAQAALADSLFAAGNISHNRQLQYQQAAQLAQLQVIAAEALAREQSIALLKQLGLPAGTALQLPQALPTAVATPTSAPVLGELLREAKTARLDIQLLQQRERQLQQRQQLAQQENGWRDINVGLGVERESDGAVNLGPSISLALPLFNQGQGVQAQLTAQLAENSALLQQAGVNAEAEIAQALSQLRAAEQTLALLQRSLPIAEQRLLLSLREVNFMLTSPFELLSEKREAVALQLAYVEANKNYWQAQTALQLAVGASPARLVQDHSIQDSAMADHSHHAHSAQDHSHHSHSITHEMTHTESAAPKAQATQEHRHD